MTFNIVDKGQEPPPLVQFEARSVENKAATIEQGHYVAKIVNYALVTPRGSKDQIEKAADAWMLELQEKSRSGKMNPRHVEFIQRNYEAWKAGMESAPSIGLDVKNWAAIDRARAEMLIRAKIYTVEDLAGANEESLRHIGMGARNLKAQAVQWLQSAESVGKTAEKMNVLEQRLADVMRRNEELTEIIDRLQEAQAESSKPKKHHVEPIANHKRG